MKEVNQNSENLSDTKVQKLGALPAGDTLLNLFNNNEQAMNAYNILKYSDSSVFLTGRAGTGKSTFIKLAATLFPNTLIVTPTGISAILVDGTTIHSAFKLPLQFHLPCDQQIEDIGFSKDDGLWMSMGVQLIIIDEISMINAAMLDCVDVILRNACNKDKPFGGKKLLMVGDPFQLPPILKSDDKIILRKNYQNEYFFESEAYILADPIKIELKKSYRQKDELFLSCLNNFRNGQNINETIKTFAEHCCNKNNHTHLNNKNSIILSFTNQYADDTNKNNLTKLGGKAFIFEAKERGSFEWGGVQAEKRLELKRGARIMLTRNHYAGLYVNGTLGVIEEVTSDKIIVTTDEGNTFKLKPEKWETNKKERIRIKKTWTSKDVEVGSMTQYPIKLAWAITVHKSQGLTFENVYLHNPKPSFALGQTYVALSRCRSLKGLILFRSLTPSDFQASKDVVNFYKSISDEERISGLLEKISNENAKDIEEIRA